MQTQYLSISISAQDSMTELENYIISGNNENENLLPIMI